MTEQRRDIQLLEETIELLSTGKEKLDAYWSSVNTAFAQWVRRNPGLDSRAYGLSIQDMDWVVHQFKVAEDKNGKTKVNNLMFVEEKRFGKDLTDAQRDTLWVFMQGMKRVYKAKTLWHGTVRVRFYGLHSLRFSGSGPEDSDWIRWDGKGITVEQLEKLIRFELHPKSLLPRDTTERRHHANKGAVVPLFEGSAVQFTPSSPSSSGGGASAR